MFKCPQDNTTQISFAVELSQKTVPKSEASLDGQEPRLVNLGSKSYYDKRASGFEPPTSSLGSRLSTYKPCCHNSLQACFWAQMGFTSGQQVTEHSITSHYHVATDQLSDQLRLRNSCAPRISRGAPGSWCSGLAPPSRRMKPDSKAFHQGLQVSSVPSCSVFQLPTKTLTPQDIGHSASRQLAFERIGLLPVKIHNSCYEADGVFGRHRWRK